MSDRYIQLHNPEGDLLYPRTDWRVILNKPSFATLEQLATKQNQLTSANSGPGITIETGEGGLLRISATQVGNYNALMNKPSINGVTLQGSLTLGALGINYNDSTSDGAFELADESGNVALRVTNQGHLVTKEFNSENLPVALSQLSNDVGYITSAYHDNTKLNISDFITTARSNQFIEYDLTGNIFNIEGVNGSGTVLSVNTSSGAITTLGFDSASVLSRLGLLESTALTATNLGSALSTGHYNISLFTNDSGYITSSYHDLTKQDVLNQNNAGDNITITSVGGVVKINAITGGGSGGTNNYNLLSNKPRFNNIELIGNKTYSDFNLPHISDDAETFEITDEAGNAILRLTEGHIVTRYFDSRDLPTRLSQFTNDVGYLTTINGLNITLLTNNAGYITSAQLPTIIINPTEAANQTFQKINYQGVIYGLPNIVNSIGGKTGEITLGSYLSISNSGQLNISSLPITATTSSGYLSTLTFNGTTYTLNTSGGGTSAGVASIGGKTGVITLHSSLTINNNNVLSVTNPVTANPSGTALTSLTSIQIGSTIYSISGTASGVTSIGGATGAITLGNYLSMSNNQISVTGLVPVTANPSGTASIDLTTIQIGSTLYRIVGSSVAGVSSLGGLTGVIGIGGSLYISGSNLAGYYRSVQVNGTEYLTNTSNTPLKFVNGTNVTFSYTNNAVTASVPTGTISAPGLVQLAAGSSVSVTYGNNGLVTITGKYTCTLNGTELTIEENYA